MQNNSKSAGDSPRLPVASDVYNELDSESGEFLRLLEEQEQVRRQRLPEIRTVLVVLSAAGMVFDVRSLAQKIRLSYPAAKVFFRTTLAIPVGEAAPSNVDLVIDLTGPGQRQKWFHARALRKIGRVVVGRNAGIFRKRLYDRIFDEKDGKPLPSEVMDREREVQKAVLALVSVPLSQVGDTPPDRGKTIALELPPMTKL